MVKRRYLRNRFVRILLSFGVLAVGMVVGLIQVFDEQGSGTAPWGALAAACGVMVVVIGILELAVRTAAGSETRNSYGWFSLVLGDDGFISTSKFQAALWTLGLAFALSYLGFLVVFQAEFEACPGTAAVAGEANDSGSGPCVVTAAAVFSNGGTSNDPDSDWDNYLLLLGGPFAVAVLAKVSTGSKVDNGTLAVTAGSAATEEVKAEATATTQAAPQAGDLLTDSKGTLRLGDSQYVIFNIVLLVYVAAAFVQKAVDGDFGLPAVPATLLALTGVSASGYVAAKATERSAPSLSSAMFDRTSGLITLSGVNLRPSGDDTEAIAQTRVVVVDSGAMVAPQTVTNTSITAKTGTTQTAPFKVNAIVGRVTTNDIVVNT